MRNLLHRIWNLALYLSFCGMTGTGLVLVFKLPPGSRGGIGGVLLGLSRHDWGAIHFWISNLFIALVCIHLFMNWRWLAKIAAGKRPWRLWAGLAVGIIIIFALLSIPVDSRKRHRANEASIPTQP